MLLDMLSRRAKKVVSYVNLIDCEGFTMAHRRLLGYPNAMAGGEAHNAVLREFYMHFAKRTSNPTSS